MMNSSDPKRQHTQSGFSLMEAIAVLSLLSITLAMAVPNVSLLVERTRAYQIRETFLSSLRFARHEAMRRNTCILVCRRNEDSQQCTRAMDWQSGWMIVNNPSCTSASRLPEPLEEKNILRIVDALPKDYTLYTPALRNTPWFINFNGRGNQASPWLGAHFELRTPSMNPTLALDICINAIGDIRWQNYRGTCS